VAVVRTRLGFSQAQFAQVVGISINTLQNWEQNRRKPTGPARVLLLMASKHPEMLLEVVA
jgi:putative transcriptional regulator